MTEMQSKTFKPGDLVRWIGEWPFPLVDAPPRENTVLAIETDGKVRLEGRHGNDALQRWWCPPSQLVHREPVQATTLEVVNDDASLKARFAALAVRLRDAADTYSESPPIFGLFFEAAEALDDAIKVDADLADAFDTNSKIAERIRSIMSTCFDGSRSGDLMFQLADMEKWVPKFTSEWKANHRRWLELCTRLGLDALDLEQRGRVAEVDAVAGEALELKRIRSIVDGDARKRHGDREGEPSWGVIADCVLAHVSQHRQAREILGVPEQVTLDQYVAETSQYLRDFETGLVNAGKWDPYPELPLNLLAREIVAQAERWRIDAEHYRGEASNATAAMVEFLSAEVARLTGEVAATRSEAARQIGARDAELAALVTRAQRLAVDLTSEANECTAHGLVSPATALRGAAAFLTAVGERVPRVFSAASSVEALHLRLEEADRHLAGLQEEAKRRDETLREETRKVVEYSNLVDQYKLGLAQVQGASAAAVSASLNPSPGATDLRHTLAAQLRVAAKTATAWEEAAIREWEPLAPSYHDGGGAVAPEIEGPYVEHRLVMAWRGQVQRMADNLSADAQSDAASSVQRLDYSKPPPGYSFPSLIGEEWHIVGPLWAENFATTTLAIVAAWAHYKAHNDPPGLEVMDDGPVGWGFQVLRMRTWPMPGTRPVREFHIIDGGQVARAAAWAWHDRRHRLIERGLAHRGRGWMGLNPWPRCLTWSDPHVSAVERWLVDSTAEMPEVLRG